jgi:hypothetical protein
MAKPTFLMTYLGLSLVIILALIFGTFVKLEGFSKAPTQAPTKAPTKAPTPAPLPQDLKTIMSQIRNPSVNYGNTLAKNITDSFFDAVNLVAYDIKSGLKDSSFLKQSNPAFQTYVTRVNTFYYDVNSGKYSGGNAASKPNLINSIIALQNKLKTYPY